jgi:tRNA (mo5U34)-methyltransferase
MEEETTAQTLRDRVAQVEWYHTIELAPGVVTPGWFDTRAVADRVPMPASLETLRCLDVGTFDGFWAFEMEKRGAGEVVAVDLLDPSRADWPAGSTPETIEAIGKRKRRGEGFLMAKDALGSSVQRLEMNVYDLDPSEVGEFDFVYLGSLLLHLRDPVGALMRVASVCRGRILVVDKIDLVDSILHTRRPRASLDAVGRPWWWKPNSAALVRMIEAAGFRPMRPLQRIFMTPGAGQPVGPPRPWQLFRRGGLESFILSRWGDPHAAVLAARASPTEV